MADKAIGDLNFAPGTVDDSNTLFVVQQAGAAYKLSGHEFILALTTVLDGHGGIKSITGPVTSGLTDTYTITFADDTTTTFDVENGKSITGIAKTGTAGLVDTYTISYNDGTTSTFTVTNGAKGDTGDAWYVWIRYSGQQPTQDSDMGTIPDNWMGVYSGTSSTAPTHYTDYNWFQIKGAKGDTGAAATIVTQSVTYQEGTSPNIQPSGTWTTTIPTVAQGNYLWTRTTVTFNSGNPVEFYSVARMGLDGSGSVSSVNNQSPDTNGNVTVTASDISTTGNTSVQTEINAVKNSLNAVEDALAPLKLTGTNTTGSTIKTGTFFYNNGVMVRATTDISVNASITSSNSTAASIEGALNSPLSIRTKVFTPETTAANSYTAYSDTTLKNHCVVGWKITGVASANVSVFQLYCNNEGLYLYLRNNGTSSVTPTAVEVYYI